MPLSIDATNQIITMPAYGGPIEYGWPDEMGTAYEPLSHYIGQSAQKLQLAVPELVHSKHVLDPKTGKLTDTGRKAA